MHSVIFISHSHSDRIFPLFTFHSAASRDVLACIPCSTCTFDPGLSSSAFLDCPRPLLSHLSLTAATSQVLSNLSAASPQTHLRLSSAATSQALRNYLQIAAPDESEHQNARTYQARPNAGQCSVVSYRTAQSCSDSQTASESSLDSPLCEAVVVAVQWQTEVRSKQQAYSTDAER